MNTLAAPVPLRLRLAARGLDGTTLLAAPALLALVALFVYPFAYGVAVSLAPKVGPFYDSYRRFFADPFMRETIGHTLALAVPTTVLSLLLAVPIAFRVRLMRRQRLLTTILVLPVTLGTVLVAQGLLTYRVAGHHRLSVHIPTDPIGRQRHRPGAGARGRHARRRGMAAVPAHLPAAAAAGPGGHVLPFVRPGLRGVSVSRLARRTGGQHACDFYRSVPCGVRAV